LPSCDSRMRHLVMDVCDFSWDAISPAIFGSLFQSVMNPVERRSQGAHYTTEKNILKVIEPLFLDDLRAEFKRLAERRDSGRRKALETFHQKLSRLRFFDPACGCGNFLIISYRELRLLEIDLLKALRQDGQLALDVSQMCQIDVDQFYGIELGEFPARIAEVAIWMMDHIMNNKLSLAFGESYVRIPLKKSPHIQHGDALEMDWARLIAPGACSYILGNPPFGGAKYQSPKQREQVRRVAHLGGSGGTLDYVTAWFITAGAYLRESRARVGFVATNSITQGEQVAQLWPLLFDRCGLEISFAHRTFAWGSDARGKAHVHVVVIGLCRRDMEPPVKRLFSYNDIHGQPTESKHQALTPTCSTPVGSSTGTWSSKRRIGRCAAPLSLSSAPSPSMRGTISSPVKRGLSSSARNRTRGNSCIRSWARTSFYMASRDGFCILARRRWRKSGPCQR